MEIDGSWYLYAKEFDSMENHSPFYTSKTRLLAKNAEEAYREADELWAFRTTSSSYESYTNQKYPTNPSIHYVISMDPETFELKPRKEKSFDWKKTSYNDFGLRNQLVSALKHRTSEPNLVTVRSLVNEVGLIPDNLVNHPLDYRIQSILPTVK